MNVAPRHARRRVWISRLLCGALLPAMGLAPAFAAQARHARAAAANEAPPGGMTIQVKSDRLTLAVAKVPQVYLAGPIDVGAPQRFEALLKAGRIPAGSDIYLDSPGGDLAAGLALGRLFRSGWMATHLGAWRKPSRSFSPPRAARCLDACTYAYLGGLYRWAPTGIDRIGLHQAALPELRSGNAQAGASSPAALAAYLQAMDVRPEYFAHVLAPPREDIVWLDAEQMFPWRVANNGRLPLAVTYQPTPGSPELTLTQVVRGGQNKVALQCAPDGVTLTAYYVVGTDRARRLATGQARSYFEVGRQEVRPRQAARPRVVNDAVAFSRPLPFSQLAGLIATDSLGAWVQGPGSALRYGFTIAPVTARARTGRFYADCEAVQRRHAP